MKKLLLPVFAISALLLGSCSTQKIAQQSNDDDVYFTEAKAKEVTFAVRDEKKEERSYRTDEQLYGGNYADNGYDGYYDDYNYDYGYASRLNRFYGRSPWRSNYYDSWYAYSYNPWYSYRYDPFYYDPWYYRGGVSVHIGLGTYPRYGYGCYGCYDNVYWGYYGAPYYNNYWGPYSYYNVYPGYTYDRRTNPNYRTRPSREGGIGRAPGISNNPVYGSPRTSNTGGRTERYPNSNDGYSSGRTSSTEGRSSTGSRPTPGPRPTRESSGRQSSEEQRRPEYSRPERSSTPTYDPGRTSSNGGNNSSSGSSDSGGSRGSSSGGSRPTRGGGR